MIWATRAAAASAVLLGLAGCARMQAAREQNYADRCAAMAIPVGSEQFLQCRLGLESLDLQRQAEARRGLRDAAATLQAAQPTYSTVPPSPYWTAPTPQSLSTICYRSGNQTQCSTR